MTSCTFYDSIPCQGVHYRRISSNPDRLRYPLIGQPRHRVYVCVFLNCYYPATARRGDRVSSRPKPLIRSDVRLRSGRRSRKRQDTKCEMREYGMTQRKRGRGRERYEREPHPNQTSPRSHVRPQIPRWMVTAYYPPLRALPCTSDTYSHPNDLSQS